ncbi:MAG: ATP-binding cassette domain-containing protein [Candidatus Coatesbacteria bacterium]|nr:ATP-binding cassette domain-containing protein [Candidatus Coatesbacteria bacterium]
MPEIAVRLENVSVTLGEHGALIDVSAEVPRGALTAVIGPNGAGKTTLLQAVLGLVPHRGRITFPAFGDSPRFGYVPQHLGLDPGAPLTALEFALLGIQRRPLWLGRRSGPGRRALKELDAVGASHLAERPLAGLSGGERQRVLLAAALALEPQLLLLDEPASGVDRVGGERFHELLGALTAERGLTALMVSHDLSMVSTHAARVLCLNRRLMGVGCAPEEITVETLTRMYGERVGFFEHHHEPAGD